MIGSILKRAVNVPAMLRHRREARRARAGADSELDLYASIFRNEFLHAGYFARIPGKPEDISLQDLRDAMRAYSDLALARISPGQKVLDIGCGMGGLLRLMKEAGARPTGLTPNPMHAAYIRREQPGVQVIESGFETLDTAPYRQAFDVVVSLEAFHNVPMEEGLKRVAEVLKPGGKWILIDYYRTRIPAYNNSGYPMQAFRDALARHGYRVTEEIDITDNALPSLAFGYLFATRMGIPLLEFALERFFSRHWLLEYLLADVVKRARGRMKLDALNPEVFARDKRYLLQQITR
jgi:2-polyprenyl-3-methyl-5-hydroxy-6-metoxy-1,4-benzoquinol methylase